MAISLHSFNDSCSFWGEHELYIFQTFPKSVSELEVYLVHKMWPHTIDIQVMEIMKHDHKIHIMNHKFVLSEIWDKYKITENAK
jgi:hypothetical protein